MCTCIPLHREQGRRAAPAACVGTRGPTRRRCGTAAGWGLLRGNPAVAGQCAVMSHRRSTMATNGAIEGPRHGVGMHAHIPLGPVAAQPARTLLPSLYARPARAMPWALPWSVSIQVASLMRCSRTETVGTCILYIESRGAGRRRLPAWAHIALPAGAAERQRGWGSLRGNPAVAGQCAVMSHRRSTMAQTGQWRARGTGLECVHAYPLALLLHNPQGLSMPSLYARPARAMPWVLPWSVSIHVASLMRCSRTEPVGTCIPLHRGQGRGAAPAACVGTRGPIRRRCGTGAGVGLTAWQSCGGRAMCSHEPPLFNNGHKRGSRGRAARCAHIPP
jgi:hypothetical protein